MDDLQRRFRRLDRVATPNLWNEAVGRAAELELTRRRAFTPAMGLLAAALLLAALGGTLAVGTWLDRQSPLPEILTYDNGMLTLTDGCGLVVGLDPATYQARELRAGAQDCRWSDEGPAAWSADGRWMTYLVAEGEAETGAWLYDAESGEARHLGPCRGDSCTDVDIAPDGSLVSYLTFDAYPRPENNSVFFDYGLVLVETANGREHYLDLPGLAGRPSFSPDGGRIALTLQGGQSGVHVIDVADVMEGEFPERSLVHGIVEAASATWSPNGAWIAVELITYREADIGQPTLWIVRPDRTEARQLTTTVRDPGAAGASWSPDSSTIAYTATVDGESGPLELRTVSVDGGPATRLGEIGCCSWSAQGPAWSPDGQWIAMVAYDGTGDESGLMIVRPDGSDARLVSDLALAPAWQPIPKD